MPFICCTNAVQPPKECPTPTSLVEPGLKSGPQSLCARRNLQAASAYFSHETMQIKVRDSIHINALTSSIPTICIERRALQQLSIQDCRLAMVRTLNGPCFAYGQLTTRRARPQISEHRLEDLLVEARRVQQDECQRRHRHASASATRVQAGGGGVLVPLRGDVERVRVICFRRQHDKFEGKHGVGRGQGSNFHRGA